MALNYAPKQKALAKLAAGSNVTLQVRRGDNTAFLTLKVGE